MGPRAECVVPFAGDCPDRLRAWEWVRERLPFPHRLGSCEGPWCKAQAVSGGEAEILVIHDADVWVPGLEEAVEAVEDGAPWAIPHSLVYRLTRDATTDFIAGAGWDTLELDQRPYWGMEGGGCVVLPRETYEAIPLDPRFVGWGQEDQAFGHALRTLCGAPWRSPEPLIHLWHPPQERMSRTRGSRESWALRRRYHDALDDPAAMQALIEEIHAYHPPDQPRMHADPALVGDD